MNLIKVAEEIWNDGERDYYFYPALYHVRDTTKRFLEVMGNNDPGSITVFDRDEMVLAILFYNEFNRS